MHDVQAFLHIDRVPTVEEQLLPRPNLPGSFVENLYANKPQEEDDFIYNYILHTAKLYLGSFCGTDKLTDEL